MWSKWPTARRPLVVLCLCVGASGSAWAEPDTFGLGNGHDGPLRIAGNFAAPAGGVLTADAPAQSFDLDVSFGVATAGDLVMLWATTGPMPSLDGGSLDATSSTAGLYELARVLIAVGTRLTLRAPLVHGFPAGTQVLRVLEPSSVDVVAGGQLRAPSYGGSTGGILAMLVKGEVRNEGVVTATGAGFGPGFGKMATPGKGCISDDEPAPGGADRGRGSSGFSGATGRGSNDTGGGGGNCSNSGGGGGGHAGRGGTGGANRDRQQVGGKGGQSISYDPLQRVFLGGGGGAGHTTWDFSSNSSGGAGGGVLWVRAQRIAGSGSWLAEGLHARDYPGIDFGLGGGGAGGAIVLRSQTTLSCGRASAAGASGSGGNTWPGGGGGGGGGGLVLLQAALGESCPAAVLNGVGGLMGTGQSTGSEPTTAGEAGFVGRLTIITQGFGALPPPQVLSPRAGEVVFPSVAVTGLASAGTSVRLVVDLQADTEASVVDGGFALVSSVELSPGPHVLEVAGLEAGLEYGRSAPIGVVVAHVDAGPTAQDGGMQFISVPSQEARCNESWQYDDDGRAEVTAAEVVAFSVEATPGAPLPLRLAVDPISGEVRWNPTALDRGEQSFVLVARSARGEARQPVQVTVVCETAYGVSCGCGAVPAAGPWFFASLFALLRWRAVLRKAQGAARVLVGGDRKRAK